RGPGAAGQVHLCQHDRVHRVDRPGRAGADDLRRAGPEPDPPGRGRRRGACPVGPGCTRPLRPGCNRRAARTRPEGVTFDEYLLASLPGLLRYAVMLTGDAHLAEDVV